MSVWDVFWFRRASRCFKLRMPDTSIHPQTGTLCCRKPQPKTYSTQQLYLMASSLLHVVSKVCSIQNMRSPISLWIFTDTEYCTYWHLAVMEYQCLRHGGWQDGHLMFPLFVVVFFLVCGLSKRYNEANAHNSSIFPQPKTLTDRTVQTGAFLRVELFLVGGCFCFGSHSLWRTSSILRLATCFMYRGASVKLAWKVEGKWKNKGRPDVNAQFVLDPAITHRLNLQYDYSCCTWCASCSNLFDVAGWSSVKLWLHATPKGGGSASWVRTLAGHLDAARRNVRGFAIPARWVSKVAIWWNQVTSFIDCFTMFYHVLYFNFTQSLIVKMVNILPHYWK